MLYVLNWLMTSPRKYSCLKMADYEDIIDHLRSVLNDLHYETGQCADCRGVYHASEIKWSSCEECDESLCEICVDGRIEAICAKCTERNT